MFININNHVILLSSLLGFLFFFFLVYFRDYVEMAISVQVWHATCLSCCTGVYLFYATFAFNLLK